MSRAAAMKVDRLNRLVEQQARDGAQLAAVGDGPGDINQQTPPPPLSRGDGPIPPDSEGRVESMLPPVDSGSPTKLVVKREIEQVVEGSGRPKRTKRVVAATSNTVKGKGRAKVVIKVETEMQQQQDVKPDLASPSLASSAPAPGSSTLIDRLDAIPSLASEGTKQGGPGPESEAMADIKPVIPIAGPSKLQGESEGVKPDTKGKGKGKAKVEIGPKRQFRWRKKCPQAMLERLGRVMDQRMFMMDRSGRGEGDAALSEVFKVLGSTGNVYTVTIDALPRCDCPDARNGAGNIPCKHIIFVFMKVLKLAPDSELWYQKHLFDDELRTIFTTAPPSAMGAYEVPARARAAWLKATGQADLIPEADREPEPEPAETAVEKAKDGNRKEVFGEDCAVCYEEITESDEAKNLLVWHDGPYGCGKALHAECFRLWSASIITRGGPGAEITCVWCRGAWPPPAQTGGGSSSGVQYTAAGYMNIAELAGVSRKRDTSSYYQGPIRGRRMDEPRYEDDHYY